MYFQTGSCPHAAQDCDFAHVYSNQTAAPPTKQCRYYLQGICTNGIWCEYRHGEGSTEDAALHEGDDRSGNSLAEGCGMYVFAGLKIFIYLLSRNQSAGGNPAEFVSTHLQRYACVADGPVVSLRSSL